MRAKKLKCVAKSESVKVSYTNIAKNSVKMSLRLVRCLFGGGFLGRKVCCQVFKSTRRYIEIFFCARRFRSVRSRCASLAPPHYAHGSRKKKLNFSYKSKTFIFPKTTTILYYLPNKKVHYCKTLSKKNA